MSHLAREAGFGTRIWSEYGYWSGRLYHLVIAVGTATILIASLLGQVATLFLAICLAGLRPIFADPLLLYKGALGSYLLPPAHPIPPRSNFYRGVDNYYRLAG